MSVTQEILYQECPLCVQTPVVLQSDGVYHCEQCGLTLKDRSILVLFRKGRFGIISLDRQADYTLVGEAFGNIVLPPDPLKVVIGNMYTDQQLAEIASGVIEVIRPVKTVLAQIILEQLGEECYINVNGLHRGHGPPLAGGGQYQPSQKTPRQETDWRDRGNLFCTSQRLVLPSDRFTFIRLDRKVTAVKAFTDGVAIQRKGEAFASYFVGCYSHEAALVAAYVMAKIPALRTPAPERTKMEDWQC